MENEKYGIEHNKLVDCSYRSTGVSQGMSIKANIAGILTFIDNVHMVSKGGIQ